MQIPKTVMRILERLQSHGFECYVVGGCVRDHLLSLPPKDWDICTGALPKEVIECFPDMTCVLTGAAHGTITVIADGIPIEVTTFRTEGGYSDHRHPDSIAFVGSVVEDLARRDFTVNAMAYHPAVGLVDPFGGRQDLHDRKLRCVGNAKERFSEDALRIVRALRFCSCYGFSLELSTEKALRETSAALAYIAVERIQSEFNKLLLGDNVDTVLRSYIDVLQTVIPELRILPLAEVPSDLAVRLALLLSHQDSTEVERVLRRLRYDNGTVRTVKTLIEHNETLLEPNRVAIKHLLYELGEEFFWKLVSFKEAGDRKGLQEVRQIAKECVKQCFSINRLAVNGVDLSALGLSGKAIGDMLERLLFEVIEERVSNDREQLLLHCRKTLDKY